MKSFKRFSSILEEETKKEYGLYKSVDKKDQRLYCDLYRKVHYLLSTKSMPSVLLWVFSHLEKEEQKVSYLIGIRFGM